MCDHFIFELSVKGISKHVYGYSATIKHIGFNIRTSQHSVVCQPRGYYIFAFAINMVFLYVKVTVSTCK